MLSMIRLFSLCLLLLPVVAKAETQIFTGSTGGGAFYTIAVPDPWNGELVIWNHGFDLAPPQPGPDLGPLAPLQLQQGYAVAASSYRQSGWALFKAKNDLESLVEIFEEQYDEPSAIILTGASLGGAISAAAIEQDNLDDVTGAYMMCGAVAGSVNWDAGLDLRLLYDAVCSEVPGAHIPGGAEGLPAGLPFTPEELALAVNNCTGVLLPVDFRTPAQIGRLEKILTVAQIPENFLLTNMGFTTFGMSDLVHDPKKLSGRLGTGNAQVDYGDTEINAIIARVTPNPGAANRLAKHFIPSGEVGDVKIVTLHTDKDGLVIVENESAYAQVVPEDQLTTAVVVEETPTHCEFTGAEAVAGWEALRGWLASGIQPGSELIQGTCLALEGIFGGPCRIDPAYEIADIDERIRPR